jgi:hypothetical protein
MVIYVFLVDQKQVKVYAPNLDRALAHVPTGTPLIGSYVQRNLWADEGILWNTPLRLFENPLTETARDKVIAANPPQA